MLQIPEINEYCPCFILPKEITGTRFPNQEEGAAYRKNILEYHYHLVQSYFALESPNCIIRDTVSHYKKDMEELVAFCRRELHISYRGPNAARLETHIKNRVDHFEAYFTRQLQKELHSNFNEYYDLYPLEFYMDEVPLEPLSEDGTAWAVDHTILDSILKELEADLNVRCGTFFYSAFQLYRSYRNELLVLLTFGAEENYSS